MPDKYFLVSISTNVAIPYEEGLLQGKINRNHLMYMAQKKAQDGGMLKGHQMIYQSVYIDSDGSVELTDENKAKVIEKNAKSSTE